MLPTTLHLDGAKYREGSLEEGVSLARHLCSPAGGRATNTVLGFTTDAAFLTYCDSVELRAAVEPALKRGNSEEVRAAKLTAAQKDAEERKEIPALRAAHTKVSRLIAARGIEMTDVAGLKTLHDQGVIASVFLYETTKFRGAYRYFAPPVFVRRLSSYSFNDTIESAINFNPTGVSLYQHAWFQGTRYWLWPYPLGTVADLGWFRNRASSVIQA